MISKALHTWANGQQLAGFIKQAKFKFDENTQTIKREGA